MWRHLSSLLPGPRFLRSRHVQSNAVGGEKSKVKKWADMVRNGEITETNYNFLSHPSFQRREEGEISASDAELTVRKTKDGVVWPFFLNDLKQARAVSKDVLLVRAHGAAVVAKTLSLLKMTDHVPWLGVPGVVG